MLKCIVQSEIPKTNYRNMSKTETWYGQKIYFRQKLYDLKGDKSYGKINLIKLIFHDYMYKGHSHFFK